MESFSLALCQLHEVRTLRKWVGLGRWTQSGHHQPFDITAWIVDNRVS